MSTIKKITPEYLDALCSLEETLFDAGSGALSRRNFLYHLNKGSILLGAFEGEELMGYILLFVYQKSARIYSIGVDPRFQKRGIASRLIERSAEIARGMRKERLSLEVRTDNTSAIGLYSACGFCRIGSLPAYYPDGVDGFKMSLWLQ